MGKNLIYVIVNLYSVTANIFSVKWTTMEMQAIKCIF